MIRLRNVSKVYPGNIEALSGVSVHIAPGEFVCIVGKSGTGKTTLAKLLFAEESPSSGTVEVGGWDISRISDRDIPLLRRQIGVVFQDFKLLPSKTVFENVAFALEVSGESGKRIQDVVPQVLKVVNLEEKAHRYPKQLSGGEQQRVAIARALSHRPKILLADEPTGNLDSVHTQEIVDLLKTIQDFGTTVVLVTHDKSVVNGLRKRVITMEDGRIVSDIEHGRYSL